MVDPVATSGLVGDATSESGQSRNKLANDLDSFLTLLTTQLKAQDPLSPMDSTEFTNQLVLFAQVEQQINQNENLESLLKSTVKTQQAMAINFLDSYVEVEANKVMLLDSKAVFTYGLSGDAKSVKVLVKDADGAVVRTFEGNPTQGLHKITWDGTDKDGKTVDDGVYVLEVSATARDDAKDELKTWTTSLGKVTGVASDGNATYLAIGDLSVDLDKVLGVFNELPLDDVGGGDDIGDGDGGDGTDTAGDGTGDGSGDGDGTPDETETT
ncbi:flagellar hook assembly protein FlgD [Roseospira visakhapatnamensis]|uniref:Basal-body rod modification protein FlgD n=1 Tax=Roseospira visakhapatnamensis TaxID=390880 RepID=A0A7W6RE86_9PROT|nr:flagellar hook capping FlgD N-terminal domain-containing protein [Roseospira visakhapatnamensis]MBB4266812.1 flagellar basal-body rod modification protein FlgD [Roseospira visakhapatnamensis]